MQTPARERLGREALPRRRRMVLAACVLASSMAFIDRTALPVALPRLRADFGADLASVQWVLNGYMLALASLTLIGGALLDGRPQTDETHAHTTLWDNHTPHAYRMHVQREFLISSAASDPEVHWAGRTRGCLDID